MAHTSQRLLPIIYEELVNLFAAFAVNSPAYSPEPLIPKAAGTDIPLWPGVQDNAASSILVKIEVGPIEFNRYNQNATLIVLNIVHFRVKYWVNYISAQTALNAVTALSVRLRGLTIAPNAHDEATITKVDITNSIGPSFQSERLAQGTINGICTFTGI